MVLHLGFETAAMPIVVKQIEPIIRSLLLLQLMVVCPLLLRNEMRPLLGKLLTPTL